MKIRATIALLLVLVTGFVRFCPACDEAALRDQLATTNQAASQQESAAAPVAGHACCQKGSAPEQPVTPSPEEPEGEDCGREQVSAILRVAVPEQATEAYSVAGQDLAIFVLPSTAEPSVEETLALSPTTQADSPPISLLALPIRI